MVGRVDGVEEEQERFALPVEVPAAVGPDEGVVDVIIV